MTRKQPRIPISSGLKLDVQYSSCQSSNQTHLDGVSQAKSAAAGCPTPGHRSDGGFASRGIDERKGRSIYRVGILALLAGSLVVPGTTSCNSGGGGSAVEHCTSTPGAKPQVTLNTPSQGASNIGGYACNVDPSTTKVVVYALTNEFWVQPYADAPFTSINAGGSWSTDTHPWESLVVLLVNPANYTPAATEITNPALDPGVLAWTQYPAGQASVQFSGRTWGIKVTGNASGDQFDPGPCHWSNDPSVVHVAADGLHLKNVEINGNWQCSEVYLLQSLGYGTYTVQVSSHFDQLDQNTVAAPLFIYAGPGQELDNEYSGADGLIPSPNDAQFVVQPYSVLGNLFPYVQPSMAKFTSQMDWRADHVTFTTWQGWSSTPAQSDIIRQWTYTGGYSPTPGQERVHINLWLLNGNAPVNGTGNEMVISSFKFQP